MTQSIDSQPLGRGLPRPVEVILALAALGLASPFLAVAALAVVATSPGPALFRQSRVGRGGQPFDLLKLRSMTMGNAGPQITAGGDPRITRVGRFLRRTKMDELPGLWNVVRGEMSLVGPRPEVPKYVDPKDPLWQRILSVRPGLTDPATLLLRDEEAVLADLPENERLTFYAEQLLPFKLRRSLEYLERRRPWSDLAFCLQTASTILLRRQVKNPTRAEIEADK